MWSSVYLDNVRSHASSKYECQNEGVRNTNGEPTGWHCVDEHYSISEWQRQS